MTQQEQILESHRLDLLDGDGPLITMITYERASVTARALENLINTPVGCRARFLVVDNNSSSTVLQSLLSSLSEVAYIRLRTNIGCPRALNTALMYRGEGEDFIKIDPDVEILTPYWYKRMHELTVQLPHAALVAGYYPGSFDHSRLISLRQTAAGRAWAEVTTANGRLMLHSGNWLDQVGYFDVLHDKQLWGYEDLLMCHRAHASRRLVVVDTTVNLRKLPTVSAYGEYDRNEQLQKLDKLYELRRDQALLGSVRVDESGKPCGTREK